MNTNLELGHAFKNVTQAIIKIDAVFFSGKPPDDKTLLGEAQSKLHEAQSLLIKYGKHDEISWPIK